MAEPMVDGRTHGARRVRASTGALALAAPCSLALALTWMPSPTGPDAAATASVAARIARTEPATRADADRPRVAADPALARPVALIATGGVDGGVDDGARGWTPSNGQGVASWVPEPGRVGGGALRLEVPAEAGRMPHWRTDDLTLEPGTAVVHVTGRVRSVGDAVPELRLAVRNRDAMGTSTVSRSVTLDREPAVTAPASAVALAADDRAVADTGADGWREFAVPVPMPSRPVSFALVASLSGSSGAVTFDDLEAHAELSVDTDDDGIDDRSDPDDDGDGFLDGEDPAPLDATSGPPPRLARVGSSLR